MSEDKDRRCPTCKTLKVIAEIKERAFKDDAMKRLLAADGRHYTENNTERAMAAVRLANDLWSERQRDIGEERVSS